MPERHVEQSARSGHLHIRSDHRFSAADRRPHRFPEHWVDARTSMLHFATHWDVVFSRCQQELSGLAQTKKGDIKFVADNPDAGYPVSSLVSNEDRPNIRGPIPGTIDLTGVQRAGLEPARIPGRMCRAERCCGSPQILAIKK